MKRLLLPAAVLLTFMAPIQSAQSAQKCPRANFMTQECLDHLSDIKLWGDKLRVCNNELLNEYQGFTANGQYISGFGAGKGDRYINKQLECIKINQKVFLKIQSLTKQ